MGSEIFHTLKKLLKERSLATTVGDEGGFAPRIEDAEQVLELLVHAIERSGRRPGDEVGLALDVAASFFHEEKGYRGRSLGGRPHLSAVELDAIYERWTSKYPLVSIEDGLHEDDWASWKVHTKNHGATCQLVGDDLFVTNPERLARGIREEVGNAILVKVNQIGTLTETLQAVAMAKRAGFGVVISHRSGETEDTTISDLAVATNAGQIKTGSLSRTDRVAKYNQLLRIEQELGAAAQFAGRAAIVGRPRAAGRS